MEITVAMRAHRSFRRLPHYRHLAGRGVDPSEVARFPLVEGETLIGVYDNPPKDSGRCLVVTDRALHVHRSPGWTTLLYGEMATVGVEGGEKLADNLEIRLHDGSTALVPVLGGDPALGTKDAYTMLMFLNHVVGDRERRLRAVGRGTGPTGGLLPAVREEHAG